MSTLSSESTLTASSENYTGHEGKRIGRVKSQEGRKLTLELEEKINAHDGLMIVLAGNEAYKFSARPVSENAVLISDDIRLPYGTPLFKISDSSITLKKLRIKTANLSMAYDIATEKAERNTDDSIRRIFSQSNTEKVLNVSEIINPYSLHIREKDAKAIRRDFLQRLEEIPQREKKYELERKKERGMLLPERKKLEGKNAPWNEEGVTIDGITYITLSPVTYDEKNKYEKLLRRLEEIEGKVMIGLNNIADVYFAKNHPEYSYFMDAYLYASNRESVALISDILKESLKGAYIAPDFDCEAVSWPVKGSPLNGYKLPIFISRSCFRHDSLGLSCEGCSRHHTFKIEQNGRRYLVTVDNCQSLVKEEPPEN